MGAISLENRLWRACYRLLQLLTIPRGTTIFHDEARHVEIVTEICVEPVIDPEVPVKAISPDPEAAPAWTETLIDWADPAFTEKVCGEIVTPAGRLLAVTEIEPVNPFTPRAETVTEKDWPAARSIAEGEAES